VEAGGNPGNKTSLGVWLSEAFFTTKPDVSADLRLIRAAVHAKVTVDTRHDETCQVLLITEN